MSKQPELFLSPVAVPIAPFELQLALSTLQHKSLIPTSPKTNPDPGLTEMDENGLIARTNATDAMFIYGEENVILYGEERMDASGRKKTIRIPPQRLHVGDIVDVAFSIVTFRRGNKLKARLLLRNIRLLDATHTQEKVKSQSMNVKVPPTLKQCLEFEYEEEDARVQIK
ncbi:hypothetical protein F5051DRAFT_445405 [Lentinula edodes]|nr:hypothetical protein F5051DRAFT_445405 [Lentinula edodes]